MRGRWLWAPPPTTTNIRISERALRMSPHSSAPCAAAQAWNLSHTADGGYGCVARSYARSTSFPCALMASGSRLECAGRRSALYSSTSCSGSSKVTLAWM